MLSDDFRKKIFGLRGPIKIKLRFISGEPDVKLNCKNFSIMLFLVGSLMRKTVFRYILKFYCHRHGKGGTLNTKTTLKGTKVKIAFVGNIFKILAKCFLIRN